MQIHRLVRTIHWKKGRRIGRGGKRGTYSGRGIKGQRSRAGAKIRPALREIVKKIPKRRGYKLNPFRSKPAVVNVGDIDRAFPEGALVNPRELVKKGLIKRSGGKIPKVKILGRGELKKSFTFQDVFFSQSAEKKLRPVEA